MDLQKEPERPTHKIVMKRIGVHAVARMGDENVVRRRVGLTHIVLELIWPDSHLSRRETPGTALAESAGELCGHERQFKTLGPKECGCSGDSVERFAARQAATRPSRFLC
jgi:hypothetical protein